MLAYFGPEPSRIVQALFEAETVPELEEALVISDIERDIAAFKTDLEILAHIGRNAPAFRFDDGEAIPVSLAYFAPQLPWESIQNAPRSKLQDHPLRDRFFSVADSVLNNIDEQRSEEFVTIRLDEAQTTVLRRATEFLATRKDAISRFQERDSPDAPLWSGFSLLNIPQRPGGSRKTTPGCHFSVSTNSLGLRVFWSGAYYISGNYFGHPTSPTTSTLMSGIYVFGVDGGSYKKIKWDRNAIVKLPGVQHVHLNF